MKPATCAARTRRIRLFAGASALVMAGACMAGPTGPSGVNRELDGYVIDDGADLPGGRDAPLAGVRIEVLDGPKAGAIVFTNAAGKYRLPPLGTSPITARASKDGFDGHTETFYPEYFSAPHFRLGQPPHTLWGDIALAWTTASITVPHVRVEILDGPNAGKVAIADQDGRYRFDDLIASPPFAMRLSKDGHQTRTYGMSELRHNRRRNVQIEAE